MPPTGTGSSITERARNGTAVDAQDGLFDKVIEDEQLIAALEERETHRERKREATALFKAADTEAKEKLGGYNLAVGEVARVGRFRIKRTAVAGRDVSFETEPTDRLTIGTIDAE